MNELVKMVVVLTILSASSGLILASVRDKTLDQIKFQQLVNEKAPAIKKILGDTSNDPLTSKFEISEGKAPIEFFVGSYGGDPNTVVFETFGTGFDGKIGLMVGVNLENDQIKGIGVTTHSETPGIGSRAKTEPAFAAQFAGMDLNNSFKVKTDGGKVDALSGATYTSRGVCMAATNASEIYKRLKPQLIEKAKTASNKPAPKEKE
ncbi:MAG: FMN-binding protein [Proteobacteria bacterium]|nr:FMN-binding protein [Pseudomonadota bacterium]